MDGATISKGASPQVSIDADVLRQLVGAGEVVRHAFDALDREEPSAAVVNGVLDRSIEHGLAIEQTRHDVTLSAQFYAALDAARDALGLPREKLPVGTIDEIADGVEAELANVLGG